MILNTCAACAKPIEHDAPSRCVGCQTRYCSDRCLRYHAHRGGHDDECEEIANGGGAEQYHAEKKYEEAVAVAVEACAEDTKGQTCFICTQALHWKTKEGLVRGCSCRGTAGYAHVSCLAEQAKILVAEAEENNLDVKVKRERWTRWSTCSLCEQRYHGVVWCALGWACWKTYVGRPETDIPRRLAISMLGCGLHQVNHLEETLSVREAALSMERRLGGSLEAILPVQSNLASTYQSLGRTEEALRLRRQAYAGYVQLYGEEHIETLREANNYAKALTNVRRFEEVKSFLRKMLPVVRRVLTDSNEITLKMRWTYAMALHDDPRATLGDFREAVTTFEDTGGIARRMLGPSHPLVGVNERCLRNARAAARARELNVSSLADELEAMTPT